jgi:ABC-type sugar transport system ATPase subunit
MRITLIASSDPAGLIDLCDRVLVFQRGRITDELSGEALSEQALSLAVNAGFAAPS